MDNKEFFDEHQLKVLHEILGEEFKTLKQFPTTDLGYGMDEDAWIVIAGKDADPANSSLTHNQTLKFNKGDTLLLTTCVQAFHISTTTEELEKQIFTNKNIVQQQEEALKLLKTNNTV